MQNTEDKSEIADDDPGYIEFERKMEERNQWVRDAYEIVAKEEKEKKVTLKKAIR